MADHVDLPSDLLYLEKVPSLERLRNAQKRRNQQLKKWAQYEKEMQSKKRKADRKRNAPPPPRKRVSFTASVALLEASTRSDAEEGTGLETRHDTHTHTHTHKRTHKNSKPMPSSKGAWGRR
ncbi:protein phosphatase 1 regulatory inhibitor subunit 16B-like [Polyodon spathula]|uniref:protein phosphatase 1 regulatory inhibitor subunit 16B-like n=1 Tax=Polyodon spathula TaxID=7913 RepID=UPI001B7F49FE|nr:protein phosphatase 1 regulatory inhibitor subunit 16B-like [Polyodon spathula]